MRVVQSTQRSQFGGWRALTMLGAINFLACVCVCPEYTQIQRRARILPALARIVSPLGGEDPMANVCGSASLANGSRPPAPSFPGPLCHWVPGRASVTVKPGRDSSPQLRSQNVLSGLSQASPSGSLQTPIINVPFTLLNSPQSFHNHRKPEQGILPRERHSS